MASENVLPVSDTQFDAEVLQSEVLVLVDFWAVWCQPCKAVAPKVDAVAGEYQGRARFFKLDVDHNPKAAMRYNVRSIPTLLVFKGGKVVDQIIGNVDQKRIADAIAKAL